jgi:putative ABC transport system ATP-binding protein
MLHLLFITIKFAKNSDINMIKTRSLQFAYQDAGHIQMVLNRLGLENKVHDRAHRLSQGEQQRAAIAMAIINGPSLILADEPTSSLDDKNCFKVAQLLKEQASLTKAHLIIITHDQRLKSLFQNFLTL